MRSCAAPLLLPPVPLPLPPQRAHGVPCLTFAGSYMAERMVFRAKELVLERAAMEEALAKEEVRTQLQLNVLVAAFPVVFSRAIYGCSQFLLPDCARGCRSGGG